MGDKKPNIFACYGQMWKRGLDFNGITSKDEYTYALLVQLLIMAAVFGLSAIMRSFYFASYLSFAGFFFILFSLIPFWALTVRRLHDIGKSGAKMLPVALVPVAGLIIIIVLCVVCGTACFFQSAVCVYGPPKNDTPPAVTDEFDPAGNEAVCVYGPPEFFETSDAPSNSDAPSASTDGDAE